MVEPRSVRPISISQVVGIASLALIVFFIIAFANEAVRTYRLRAWRDQLQSEIGSMELERQNLLLEIQRRESSAWIDEALKETGQVPPGVMAVDLVPPEGVGRVAAAISNAVAPAATIAERMQSLSYFDNDNWRAWLQLLVQSD